VKKMFFGALLFMYGFIVKTLFAVLSFIHPWDYNNITGLRGFLLGTKTTWVFVLSCMMSIVGIVICFYEAYIRK